MPVNWIYKRKWRKKLYFSSIIALRASRHLAAALKTIASQEEGILAAFQP
jgi:hypothetical protein